MRALRRRRSCKILQLFCAPTRVVEIICRIFTRIKRNRCEARYNPAALRFQAKLKRTIPAALRCGSGASEFTLDK